MIRTITITIALALGGCAVESFAEFGMATRHRTSVSDLVATGINEELADTSFWLDEDLSSSSLASCRDGNVVAAAALGLRDQRSAVTGVDTVLAQEIVRLQYHCQVEIDK